MLEEEKVSYSQQARELESSLHVSIIQKCFLKVRSYLRRWASNRRWEVCKPHHTHQALNRYIFKHIT